MNIPLRETAADEEIVLGEIASSLGFLLRLAQVKVFDDFFEALSAQGLRPGEFTMLWVIALNPGVRQGVIARKLRIKPAHMTKLVQRAVDAGRIARSVPGDDRRSVHLRLTPAGERFVEENRPWLLRQFARENAILDEQEFAMLIRLLQKFSGLEGHQ
jgi:DNA-binding MarR family transcriptional regulator